MTLTVKHVIWQEQLRKKTSDLVWKFYKHFKSVGAGYHIDLTVAERDLRVWSCAENFK